MLWQSGMLKRSLQGPGFWLVNYHRISPPQPGGIVYPPYFDLCTHPQRFEEHLQFYKNYFRVLSLTDALKAKPTDKPHLVISLDDGYADNYQFAYPLLKQYNCPAIIYVVTQGLEGKELLWDNQIFYSLQKSGSKNVTDFFNKTCNLHLHEANPPDHICKNVFDFLTEGISSHQKRLEIIHDLVEETQTQAPEELISSYYLKPEQLMEMAQHNIEIGSHTCTHALLGSSTEGEIKEELEQSKKFLKRYLGNPSITFAIPVEITMIKPGKSHNGLGIKVLLQPMPG